MGRRASAYPLWVGLVAFGALGAVWWTQGTPPPAPTASLDAGTDASEPPDAEPETPAIRWTIEGRAAIDAGPLQACLAEQPVARARVSGARGAPLLVIAGGVPAPQTVEPGPPIVVRTPIVGDRRRAALLHLATVACLRAPGASVLDPALGRRLSGYEWPRPAASGGLPVEALVLTEYEAGRWTSRGLTRLGLPELGLRAPETPAAQRFLQRAVAAWVVAGPAEALTVGERPLAALSGPPWWDGPATVRGLAEPDGSPATVPPETSPGPKPKQPSTSATDAEPRPAARRPPTTAPKAPPKRPAPKGPTFLPDYR